MIAKDSDTPLDYAHVLNVAPTRPMHSCKAVMVAWLIPAVLHVIWWIVYCGGFGWSDPFYVRIGVAAVGLCGFWHAILIVYKVIPPEGFYRFYIIAAVVWAIWLWVVTLPAFRRLPLGLHFGLSLAWNIFSCLLVFATYS